MIMSNEPPEPRFPLIETVVEAWSHPFTCRCEICRQAWKMMGKDGDSYGPFTDEEINDG